jgi:peptidyl-prolyl cis-trans isomerase D
MSQRKPGRNIFVWIMMGLLIIGLGGFGIGNFGGGAGAVGSVGTVEISVDDYARAFDDVRRAEMQRLGAPLSVPQALEAGLGAQALGSLVTAAALEHETARLGISVGDAALQQVLRGAALFQGPTGAFDPNLFDAWLDNRNMSAPDFLADLRADIARGLLLDAVAGGVRLNPAHADALLGMMAERRDLIWAPLTPDLLEAPVPEATEADIAAWYAAHPEDFTAPETRQVTYAALTPASLAATIAPDPDAVQAAYAARADEFDIPERRLVERLVFPDAAAAAAARAALDAGETDFAALAGERGLDLADLDLGDVRREALSPDAAEAVFGLAEPGIVGPVETALGPALFRVNAILAARLTPFEEVRDALAAELAAGLAMAEMENRREAIADLIAGGATIEDLGTETAMETASLAVTAEDPGTGIAADPAFRAAALAAEPGDFPQLQELDGGGLFALRLDSVTPPRLRPLDAVRAEAAAAWRAEETATRLAARGAELREALENRGSFTALGLAARAEAGLDRGAQPAGAPAGLMQAAFALPQDGVALVAGQPPALVRVTAIVPPDRSDAMVAMLADSIDRAAAQGLSDDIVGLYAEAIRSGVETRLDGAVIDAVNAQLR